MIVLLAIICLPTSAVLNLNPSVRSQSLGYAAIVLDDDGSAIFCNPAALAANGARFSLTHWLGGTNFGAASVSLDKGIGLGLFYLNYGKLGRRGENGEYLGDFTPYDAFLTCGKSLRVARGTVLLGAALRGFASIIDDYHEYGFAGTAGVLTRLGPVRLGLKAENLGVELGGSSTLPARIGGGAGVTLGKGLKIALEGKVLNQQEANCGVEYSYENLSLRGGVRWLERFDYTGGFAYRVDEYEISYAFLLNEFGTSHAFGLGIDF